jgi:hypothetical protein
MTVVEVLQELQTQDIRLTVDGARVVYDAPAGAMTPALLALLRQHKQAVMILLTPLSCPYCHAVVPPDLNAPEVLCGPCGEVLGYLSTCGVFTPAPADTGPIAWAERAAILEYAGGVSRGDAERLAWERLQASLVDPTVVGTSREKAGLWEDEACEDWATLQITSAGVLALAAKYPR